METYNIVFSQGGWGVSQNKNRPEGVTRSEKAHFEAIYLAASNDIKKVAAAVRVGSLAQLRMASGRLRQHFLWRSSLQLSGLCRPFIGIDDSLNKRCARRLQRSFDRGHDFLRPLTAISVGAARFGKGHEIDWR
jgi:hypothetical protein